MVGNEAIVPRRLCKNRYKSIICFIYLKQSNLEVGKV